MANGRAIAARLLVLSVVACSAVLADEPASKPTALPAPVKRTIDFEVDVHPILKARCVECHSREAQEAKLVITSRTSLLRGGESGERAIVPGKSEQSYLIRLITGQEPDKRMPPEGKPLTPTQIAILRAWIDQGLKMPVVDDAPPPPPLTTDQWSFQPVAKPQPPESDNPWGSNAIDAYVLRRMRQARMSPSAVADRRTLIRRLYLVMHGLPPTPEQVDHFVSDDSPDTWRKLVDQVLESPRYGERWARHWLDLIRFGETHGFETNRERPNAWHFRDWVIDSLNSDKPYDQFVREQIAGDALGEPIGTGFLVAGPHDLVKSPDINLTLMQRQDELSDMINTVGTAFLGLTLGCARCHNHKFDPITQRDFYSIQAVFAGVQHGDRPLPVPADEKEKIAGISAQIAQLREKLKEFIPRNSASRVAVNAKHNVEQFDSVKARFVRFTVLATNSSEPCIDELELFAGKENVALAERGAVATSSGNFPNNPLHKLEHINDGQYGNGRSWISNQSGAGWIQIELPETVAIDRIEWARDRQGKYGDRLAIRYKIETAQEPEKWQLVASSDNRLPFKAGSPSQPVYKFDLATPVRVDVGRRWLAELQSLQKEHDRLIVVPTVYAGKFAQPGPTHRLYRGEPKAKREEVSPDALEVLGTLGLERTSPEQLRRLKFAEWVASRDNPLTARVLVNRLWQFHFGTGIVATPSDFGANGVAPTHPELLDWLAREFMDNGWSIKHMHRRILLSNTWQQDSRPKADSLQVDAASQLLWRFAPRRLEAEAIRDSILIASGVLDLRMGGPGFSGFEVQMENVRHFFPKTSFGPEDWRRMIYMTIVRQERESVFGVFDCPDASQVTPVRSRSTTPLQALNLLNSQFVLQQAELFAKRLNDEAGDSAKKQIHRAYVLSFGRQPTDDEHIDASDFVEAHGLTMLCRALLNSNEFLFVP